MNELLLGLLFILILGLGAAFVWLWRDNRAAVKRQDEKIANSLDDLDLVEFQETVSSLLSELQKAGAAMVKQADERGRSLEQQGAKARELDKKLGQRVAALEKQLEKVERYYRDLESKIPARAPRTEAAKPVPGPKPAPAKKAPSQPKPALERPQPVPAFIDLAQSADASPEAPVEGAAAAPAPGRQYSRYAHVHELADQGLSTDQIARQAHLLPGEVELILRLKRK